MNWNILWAPTGMEIGPPRTLCEERVSAIVIEEWAKIGREEHNLELPPISRESTQIGWLDMGGIAHMDRKIFTLDKIDGLEITVPAGQVTDYLEVLEAKKARAPETFGVEEFRTVPSMFLGILLTLPQYDRLVTNLRGIQAEADAIATIENEAFNRTIGAATFIKAKPRRVGPIHQA